MLIIWLVALVLIAVIGGVLLSRSRHVDPAASAAVPTESPTLVVVEASATIAPVTPTSTPPPAELVGTGAIPGVTPLAPEVTPAALPSPAAQATPQSIAGSAVVTGTPANAGDAVSPAFDSVALGRRMLDLVNADRTANGLQPVAWDGTAATAGQQHAEEMASLGYMSHWNVNGYGPDHRYSQAGGLHYSQENVYRLVHRWEDGSGAPIADWEEVLLNAQAALMESPGHRANILAPEHTHLGVGIAYQPASGIVSITQEFANHYVNVEPLPSRAQPGDRIVLRGILLSGSTSPLVNVHYEPLPTPLTLEELNNTGTYIPRAQPLTVPAVHVDEEGGFVAEYTLDPGAQPGLYHVLVWVNAGSLGAQVPAVDAVVEVR